MLLLALALVASPLTPEGQYGFQDSRLGTGVGDWQRAHPDGSCANGEMPSEVECLTPAPDFLPNGGGVTYSFSSLGQQSEARLWKISITAIRGGGAAILDGLTGKWGKPHKYGLYADTWSRSGSTISYMRLGGGDGAATFVDDAIEARRDAMKKEKAAKSF